MRLVIILIFFIFVLQNISGIKISEIEINPAEGASGKEWVELYNDEEELDISGWTIYDGLTSPKKRYTVPENTTLSKGGYFLIEFSSARILNNNGDFVALYDSNDTKIDETPILEEIESSEKTWQLCENWKFFESTKGEENNCDLEGEPQNNETPKKDNETLKDQEEAVNEEDSNQDEKEIVSLSAEYSEEQNITRSPIEAKYIKTEENNPVLDKTRYAEYGLASFCILLLVLFLIKRKAKKTEFEK